MSNAPRRRIHCGWRVTPGSTTISPKQRRTRGTCKPAPTALCQHPATSGMHKPHKTPRETESVSPAGSHCTSGHPAKTEVGDSRAPVPKPPPERWGPTHRPTPCAHPKTGPGTQSTGWRVLNTGDGKGGLKEPHIRTRDPSLQPKQTKNLPSRTGCAMLSEEGATRPWLL